MSAARQQAPAPRRTRDQERALFAYASVEAIAKDQLSDYKILVQDLATTTLRSGLAAALAWVERKQNGGLTAAGSLLGHLAQHLVRAGVVDAGAAPGALPGHIRALTLPRYQLATREVLHLAVWLKRAAESKAAGAEEARDG